MPYLIITSSEINNGNSCLEKNKLEKIKIDDEKISLNLSFEIS